MGDVDQGHGANGQVTEAPRTTWLADAADEADRTGGANGHDRGADEAPLVVEVDLRTAASPPAEPATAAPAAERTPDDHRADGGPTVDRNPDEPDEPAAVDGPVAPVEVAPHGGADTTMVLEAAALDQATGASADALAVDGPDGRDDDPYGSGVTGSAGTAAVDEPALDEPAAGPLSDWPPTADEPTAGEPLDGLAEADDGSGLSGYLCGVCEEPLPFGAEACPACATPVAPLDEDELVAGPYVLGDAQTGGPAGFDPETDPETESGTEPAWWRTAEPLPAGANAPTFPEPPPAGAFPAPWAEAPPAAAADQAPTWPPAPAGDEPDGRAPAQLWAPPVPSEAGPTRGPDTVWPTLAPVDGPPGPAGPAAAPPAPPAPAPGAPAAGGPGTSATTRVAALGLAAVLLVGALVAVIVTRGRDASDAARTVTPTTVVMPTAPAPSPAPGVLPGAPAGLAPSPPDFCSALLTFRVVGDYDTVASRFMIDAGPFVAAIETAALTAPDDARPSTSALVPLVRDLADRVAVRSIRNSTELQAVLLPTGMPAWGHIYEVIVPAVIRHCAGRT